MSQKCCVRPLSDLVPLIPVIYPTWQRQTRRETMMVVSLKLRLQHRLPEYFTSLVQPLINTLISLNTKPEAQGMALGLNSSYLSIANAFGPVIAGMTIDRAHLATYGYALYLAGILTFLVLLLAIFTRKRYAIGH